MLKFFRRIRLKLLDKGSLRKYLVYTIGEILIVVIGILFALQVNNWNEMRKEKNFERKILSELNISLQRNIDYLNMGIGRNEDAIASCHIILKYFEEGLPYEDSLDHHFSSAIQWFNPSLNNNAYESLKSYGLHLLKNDAIRDSLGSIYEWKWIEILNTRQEKYFFNTVAPILTDLFESIEFRGNMKPLDFYELKKSKKYSHILRTLISNRKSQSRYWIRSLRMRKNLVEMITMELNKE